MVRNVRYGEEARRQKAVKTWPLKAIRPAVSIVLFVFSTLIIEFGESL